MQQQQTTILPNSSCEVTKNLELEYLNQYLPELYQYKPNDLRTVIHSRTLNSHYMWPLDKPLTIESLKIFERTGHTLSIDNTKSYNRLFCLDLDCMCRVRTLTVSHLNETLINNIVQTVKEKLQMCVAEPNEIYCDVWNNGCGFHIYTNVFVSLPMHLYIAKIIEITHQQDPVVVEVPSNMPLPYSAKKLNEPYLSLMSLNKTSESLHMTVCQNNTGYNEIVSYDPMAKQGLHVATLLCGSSNLYINLIPKAVIKSSLWSLTYISQISLNNDFGYFKQLYTYLNNIISEHAKSMRTICEVDLSEFNDVIKYKLCGFMDIINTKFVGGCSNGDLILNQTPNNGYNDIIHTNGDGNSLSHYNQNTQITTNTTTVYNGTLNISCNLFIKLSAIDNGCLYLQHFVAALYKYLDLLDFELFRSILRKIYERIIPTNIAVRRFVQYIDIGTMNAYKDSYDEILGFLMLYINNYICPTSNIDEIIYKLMAAELNSTPELIIDQIYKKNSIKDAQPIITNAFLAFLKVLYKLHVVHYDPASLRYHRLHENTNAFYNSYLDQQKIPFFEKFTLWVGSMNVNARMSRHKETVLYDYVHKTALRYADTSMMFATYVGVFNCVTGLYSANSYLLPFQKVRYYAVWDKTQPERLTDMYINQNEDLISKYEIVEKYVDVLHNNTSDLYYYAIVIPAIIQMRKLICISNDSIFKMCANLSDHSSYKTMYFLVEYYPIDPRFIYLLIVLSQKYGGIEKLILYNDLCLRVFNLESSFVTADDWKNKFSYIYDEVTYDDSKKYHFDRLMSMKGAIIEEFDENTIFLMTIIAVGMLKCFLFEPLLSAFNVKMPEILHEHEAYKDISYKSNHETMTENLKRAKRIMFGDSITPFEDLLIKETFSICLSTNFHPEITSNYLDAISLLFIPRNILKKIILVHGESGVGKSYISDKITAMMMPRVGRFLNLFEAIKRAETTTENNITILNEARHFEAEKLKCVTGNDAVSTSKFYSQNYELKEAQSHLFGATNVTLKFKTSARTDDDVDRTTVQRIYAVTLIGTQVDSSSKQADLFTMFTENSYYKNIISDSSPDNLANPLAWITYVSYCMRRDENFTPYLNTNTQSCRDYQNKVYSENNRLYKFLSDSGFSDEPHFNISTKRFFELMTPHYNKYIPDRITLVNIFKSTFDIDLDRVEFIRNFQQSHFIEHVMKNMAVVKIPDSILTLDDIRNQVRVYSLEEHRTNAIKYFTIQNNKFYDEEEMVYKGIDFCKEQMEYDDNVFERTTLNVDTSSLVLSSV